MGPVVHQGKPHEASAGGVVCFLRFRSTRPDGCSASQVPRQHGQRVSINELPSTWELGEAIVEH